MKADLAEVVALDLFYHGGKDSMGRPIMVFVGSRMPNSDDSALLDKVFLYLIKTLDPIAESPYIMVYLHTEMRSFQRPDFSWLKKVYNILDAKQVVT